MELRGREMVGYPDARDQNADHGPDPAFLASPAATWLMMACEGPLLAALIARLPQPKFNLAVYGVAYALALIIEAPVIMLMSASTALARDRQAYIKLRMFTQFLNGMITAVMVIGVLLLVFEAITIELINLPPEVANCTFTAMLIMLPWPGAIGVRRFYQGVLIRSGRPRRVAAGTVIRLLVMAATGFACFKEPEFEGAVVGAAALTAGVVAEALASRLLAHGEIKRLLADDCERPGEPPPLSFGSISRFYYPLALTSLLSLGVHPLITFFVGRARAPVESLAVLPVIGARRFCFAVWDSPIRRSVSP